VRRQQGKPGELLLTKTATAAKTRKFAVWHVAAETPGVTAARTQKLAVKHVAAKTPAPVLLLLVGKALQLPNKRTAPAIAKNLLWKGASKVPATAVHATPAVATAHLLLVIKILLVAPAGIQNAHHLLEILPMLCENELATPSLVTGFPEKMLDYFPYRISGCYTKLQ